MDNFAISVTSEGLIPLELAMEIAFSNHGCKAIAYKATKDRFTLYWIASAESDKEVIKLPVKMDSKACASIVSQWLGEEAEYGKQPDHDGDNGKGWKVFTTAWGMVDGDYRAICAIVPVWAMYGK